MPVTNTEKLYDRPLGQLIPRTSRNAVVFNSPHSGRLYPKELIERSVLDAASLRRSEDCFVDELFGFAPKIGSSLLYARFPRAWLDVNREPFELDQRMFDTELPKWVNTTSLRVTGGLGTIPRIVAEGTEIYDRPLKFAEIKHRIDGIYRPYHASLERLLSRATSSFGYSVLFDCHSMPSSAALNASDRSDGKAVDIILGDRHGSSCSAAIAGRLHGLLKDAGFSVGRNRPYAGGFITQSYGRPSLGQHALQVEVNRGIYMNETSLRKSVRFTDVRDRLHNAFATLLIDMDDLIKPQPIAAE